MGNHGSLHGHVHVEVTVKLGVHQLSQCKAHMALPMVGEHAGGLRSKLMALDGMLFEARQTLLFGKLEGQWKNDFEAKQEELSQANVQTDLAIKLVKTLLSSLKKQQ